MTKWRPDTCDCIIIVDETFTEILTVVQKCQLHKNINKNALLQVILAHNRGFNTANGRDKNQRKADKRTELMRIRALGEPVIETN